MSMMMHEIVDKLPTRAKHVLINERVDRMTAQEFVDNYSAYVLVKAVKNCGSMMAMLIQDALLEHGYTLPNRREDDDDRIEERRQRYITERKRHLESMGMTFDCLEQYRVT